MAIRQANAHELTPLGTATLQKIAYERQDVWRVVVMVVLVAGLVAAWHLIFFLASLGLFRRSIVRSM